MRGRITSPIWLGVAVTAKSMSSPDMTRLRASAPVRRSCVAHPDDPFQPPAVHNMITILEAITRRFRSPSDASH
jgi:hypothetical protein